MVLLNKGGVRETRGNDKDKFYFGQANYVQTVVDGKGTARPCARELVTGPLSFMNGYTIVFRVDYGWAPGTSFTMIFIAPSLF